MCELFLIDWGLEILNTLSVNYIFDTIIVIYFNILICHPSLVWNGVQLLRTSCQNQPLDWDVIFSLKVYWSKFTGLLLEHIFRKNETLANLGQICGGNLDMVKWFYLRGGLTKIFQEIFNFTHFVYVKKLVIFP